MELKSDSCFRPLTRHRKVFSSKDQTLNNLCFVGHMVSDDYQLALLLSGESRQRGHTSVATLASNKALFMGTDI